MGYPLPSCCSRPGLRRLAAIAVSSLLALVLAGCDDGDGDGDPSDEPESESCAIDITISGAKSGRAQYDGCAVTDLIGGRMDVLYFAFETELDWSVSLSIGPVPANEPSSGVPVEVGINVTGEGEQPRWSTGDGDCVVDLNTFEPREVENLGPGYWLVGSGSCTGPAAPVTGSAAMGDITISPFTFQVFARSNE